MEAVTLLIAITASFIALTVQPIYSLIIYITALAWYPSYLTVSVGTIDFTVCRIVILAIFANLFLQTKLPKQFKFIWLDKLVVLYFLGQIVAGAFTSQALTDFLENRAGAVFDMVLPYFGIRMIVTNKTDCLILLKCALIIATPLAIVGFYQCLTGNNPVGFLHKYSLWKGVAGYVPRPRYGFSRANAVFSHSIMYGLFFAMFGPICAGLYRSLKKNKWLYLFGIGLMAVGIFSSMSSGPILAALLSILFIAFYRWRKYWKPIVITIIVMCSSVEIISNRHFYDVLGGFTLSPVTAWYRSKLIDVALFEGGMSGHWLAGFGYNIDPGWSAKIDGQDYTDIVNHYLLILSRYGLLGLVPFFAMNIAATKRLVDAYKASTLDSDKWLIWCLSAGLFGLACAFMTVSLFGQPTTIYYMILGLCGAMPKIVSRPNSQRGMKIGVGFAT
ncbi:MAG: O-antigen ligase family protein [Planctomycetota bacterium]